jgi:hypothetical protein
MVLELELDERRKAGWVSKGGQNELNDALQHCSIAAL